MTSLTQPISQLTQHLEMGVVELLVKNLNSELQFYQKLVGLEVIEKKATKVLLGSNNRPSIVLLENKALSPAGPNSAGLYHTAILFESRSALAQAHERILLNTPFLYSGSADHLVSEAFYFNDPEGNGVELYFDKDPSTWVWQNGSVLMGSEYINAQEYIKNYSQQSGSKQTKIGHIHLKVGNIEEAKLFYVTILGLKIIVEMPTALFVSDGQYHHHLGMNIWESSGAGKRTASLGLKSFEIQLNNKEDKDKLIVRLQENNIQFAESKDIVTVSDPWGNEILVK